MGDQEQQHPKIVDAKDLPIAEVQALSEITFLSEMGYVNFQEQMDKIKNDPDAKKDTSGYFTPDVMKGIVKDATDKAIEMGKITPQDQTRLMEKYEVVRSHTGSWDTIGLQVHLIKSMETQQTYAVLPGMGQGNEFIKDFIEAGAVSITGGSLRLGATKEFIETAAKDGLISREQGVVVVAHSLGLPVTLKLREEIPEWVQQAYLVHGPGQGGVVRELISQMGGKEYHYDPRITMIEIKEGSNFIHDFGRITAGTIVQVNHMNPKNFEILGFDTGITDTHGIREVRTALNHAHVSQLNEASEKIAQWEAYMKSLPAQSMSQSSERAVEITMEGLKAQQAQAAEAVKQRIQELESVIREVEHRIRRGEIREDRRETVREKIDGWRQEQKVLNQVVEKHGSVFVKQHPDGSPYHQAEIVQNVRDYSQVQNQAQPQAQPSVMAAENQAHIVQKNETLSGIAQKHKTTVKELQEANRIKDPNKIIAGQALIVPEHSVTTQAQSVVAVTHQQNTPVVNQGVNQGSQSHHVHVIQKNETLSEIAQKHKTTVENIKASNPNIKDVNKVYVGQTVQIVKVEQRGIAKTVTTPETKFISKFFKTTPSGPHPSENRQVVEPVVREVETHRVEIPWYERYTPPEPPAMSGWSSAEQEMRPDPPSNNSEELLPLWRQLRDPSLIRKLLVSNDGANEHACAKTWTWKPEEMEPITREIWSQTGVKMEGVMTVATVMTMATDVATAVGMGENISSNMDEQLKYSVLQLKKEQKDGLGQSRSPYPSLHHARCSDVAQLVQHTPEFLGSASSSPMVLSQISLS